MVGGLYLRGGLVTGALMTACLAIGGCRSSHIDVTIENRTGAAIQLLEVDYPSASFGVDSLTAGQDYHYRIQVRLSGPLKVQYTAASGKLEQMKGTTLSEHQQGRVVITLLPGGKAEFHPELTQGP